MKAAEMKYQVLLSLITDVPKWESVNTYSVWYQRSCLWYLREVKTVMGQYYLGDTVDAILYWHYFSYLHYLQIFEDKNSEFLKYKFTSKMSSKFVPKFYDHPHLYSTTFKYLGFSKFKISSERQIFNIFVPRNFDSFANIFTFTYFAKSKILYRNVCDAPKDISSIFRCIKLIATRIPHEDKWGP